MKILGVIPARYASVRFPGKPLARIAGKPMVQWVYEAARAALPRVVVATDDRRIVDFIESLGGEVLMTSSSCRSGTDRVAEVAGKIKADLYFNIQGDEPLLSARTVKAVLALHRDRRTVMGTAAVALSEQSHWRNPDVVKVLVDKTGHALYFSRAEIPYFRNKDDKDDWMKRMTGKVESVSRHPVIPSTRHPSVLKHLGLYSYTADFLKKFVRWPQTFLEISEKLEQLRALEHGARIRVALTSDDSIGVDRPEDVKKVEGALRKRKADND